MNFYQYNYSTALLTSRIHITFFFFLNDPAPTEFYPLPQPAALPINPPAPKRQLGFHRAAVRAHLRRGKPSVGAQQTPAPPDGLVGKLSADLAEPGVRDRAGKPAVP